MRKFNLFFSIVLVALTISCSKEDKDEVNSIIGTWLVITESDYYCGTNDLIGVDRIADSENIVEYLADDTFQYYRDGVAADWSGTWKDLGGNKYSRYWENDNVSSLDIFEFPDNNTMYIKGIDACYTTRDDISAETYTTWKRQ